MAVDRLVGALHAAEASSGARAAARLLALSLVYLPLLCLAGAALEPSVGAERLLVMLGSPALAALTLAALGGYRALAVACGATALAYAIDLIAGSPLTQLSLVGPNPAAGHRFYGIGNELEACLVVLILVGTGAALSSFAPSTYKGHSGARRRRAGRLPRRRRDLHLRLRLRALRGRRRRGDQAAARRRGRRRAARRRPPPRPARLPLPLPALALLSAADLITGANAHLTRTVLDAKSGGDVLAVFGHRLREAAKASAARSSSPACRSSSPPPRSPGCGATACGLAARPARRCAPACSAPSPRPSSAPSPTTPAPSCSRSAPSTCSSSSASPGPKGRRARPGVLARRVAPR